jgi:hypothetical protein
MICVFTVTWEFANSATKTVLVIVYKFLFIV